MENVIQKYQEQGALVYIDENDLQPQGMFKTLTTMVPVVESDFHDKPINGEMMPKAHHVQRIARAAGVTFETVDIKKQETSWTVIVRAFRRGPDGKMEHADGSYDYDWVDRAKDGPKKFALQRAETGAQLRAIRKILGIPIGFNRENFKRAVAVCRIVVDTDAMLKDPEMRQAAIAAATGSRGEIFGQKQIEDTTEDAEFTPEATDISDATEVTDGEFDFGSGGDTKPLEDGRQQLVEWSETEKVKQHTSNTGASATQAIEDMLNKIDAGDATTDEVNELLEKLSSAFGQGVKS